MLRLSLVSVAFLVTACGPRGACPAYPHTGAEAALSAHQSARSTARVIRAEARVDSRGREGRIRGTVLMFLERPDRVRFDVMTQFGPAAVLTSDGERFQLMDMRENRFLTGPTCPSNIGRLLGVELEGSEVARFLMGDSPRIDAEDQALVCEGDGYQITLNGDDGTRQEMVFFVPSADREAPPEEQRMRLTRSELFEADGSSRWQVTYDDYQSVEAEDGAVVELPFAVHFVDHRNGADTLVRFRDIDMNVEVNTAIFSQTPPAGLPQQHVACD